MQCLDLKHDAQTVKCQAKSPWRICSGLAPAVLQTCRVITVSGAIPAVALVHLLTRSHGPAFLLEGCDGSLREFSEIYRASQGSNAIIVVSAGADAYYALLPVPRAGVCAFLGYHIPSAEWLARQVVLTVRQLVNNTPAVVFDLDDTLVYALIGRDSLADEENALVKMGQHVSRLARRAALDLQQAIEGTDSHAALTRQALGLAAKMQVLAAQAKTLQTDRRLMEGYIEGLERCCRGEADAISVTYRGRTYHAARETTVTADGQEIGSGPVLRIPEASIVLSCLVYGDSSTVLLLHVRDGWSEMRAALLGNTPAAPSSTPLFEVRVCTTGVAPYAQEAWRLLDHPQFGGPGFLIPPGERASRVVSMRPLETDTAREKSLHELLLGVRRRRATVQPPLPAQAHPMSPPSPAQLAAPPPQPSSNAPAHPPRDVPERSPPNLPLGPASPALASPCGGHRPRLAAHQEAPPLANPLVGPTAGPPAHPMSGPPARPVVAPTPSLPPVPAINLGDASYMPYTVGMDDQWRAWGRASHGNLLHLLPFSYRENVALAGLCPSSPGGIIAQRSLQELTRQLKALLELRSRGFHSFQVLLPKVARLRMEGVSREQFHTPATAASILPPVAGFSDLLCLLRDNPPFKVGPPGHLRGGSIPAAAASPAVDLFRAGFAAAAAGKAAREAAVAAAAAAGYAEQEHQAAMRADRHQQLQQHSAWKAEGRATAAMADEVEGLQPLLRQGACKGKGQALAAQASPAHAARRADDGLSQRQVTAFSHQCTGGSPHLRDRKRARLEPPLPPDTRSSPSSPPFWNGTAAHAQQQFRDGSPAASAPEPARAKSQDAAGWEAEQRVGAKRGRGATRAAAIGLKAQTVRVEVEPGSVRTIGLKVMATSTGTAACTVKLVLARATTRRADGAGPPQAEILLVQQTFTHALETQFNCQPVGRNKVAEFLRYPTRADAHVEYDFMRSTAAQGSNAPGPRHVDDQQVREATAAVVDGPPDDDGRNAVRGVACTQLLEWGLASNRRRAATLAIMEALAASKEFATYVRGTAGGACYALQARWAEDLGCFSGYFSTNLKKLLSPTTAVTAGSDHN